jgi:hypothetical protein
LRGIADAEQHLFVVADARREITELLWIQIESYLPDVKGEYDYAGDGVVSKSGIRLFTNVRQYTTPPQPDSDRARAYDLLSRAHYDPEKLASRVRFVHLPNEARRSEVMIVYAMRGTGSEELIQRALRKFSVARR